jgi:hypothetical protein
VEDVQNRVRRFLIGCSVEEQHSGDCGIEAFVAGFIDYVDSMENLQWKANLTKRGGRCILRPCR